MENSAQCKHKGVAMMLSKCVCVHACKFAGMTSHVLLMQINSYSNYNTSKYVLIDQYFAQMS